MSTRRKIINNFDIKKKSRIFIPPMLRQVIMHQTNTINYLIDCSIWDDYKFVLTFDNVDYEPLKMDIYRLQNHHDFCDINYDDNDKEINVLMKIPEEFKEDFDKFLNGKYTKFSDTYKSLLVKRWGEARQEGFTDKIALPKLSVFDVIEPTLEVKNRLAESLSTKNSKVLYTDIEEVMTFPDKELEYFKTIDELKHIYGIK